MIDTSKLKQEQIELAKKIITKDNFEKIELIGGADCSMSNDKIVGAVAVCDKNGKCIEKKYSILDVTFPYIPGYLSYREAPAIISAFNKLQNRPDILMVDGNGILHPRGMGLASHVGLALNVPTIGIAKSLLCGEEKDGKIYINERVKGVALKTKEYSKPIYVSVGHKISLKKAVKMVKEQIIQPHKLPEPLYLAHRYADRTRENILGK